MLLELADLVAGLLGELAGWLPVRMQSCISLFDFIFITFPYDAPCPTYNFASVRVTLELLEKFVGR